MVALTAQHDQLLLQNHAAEIDAALLEPTESSS